MIDAVKQWVLDFVEMPHPDFNGKPICPFAKTARKLGKVNFIEFKDEWPDEEIANQILAMDLSKHDMTLLVCSKDRWSEEQTFRTALKYEKLGVENNILLEHSHPDTPWMMGNLNTVYQHNIIIWLQNFEQAALSVIALKKTNYYELFDMETEFYSEKDFDTRVSIYRKEMLEKYNEVDRPEK